MLQIKLLPAIHVFHIVSTNTYHWFRLKLFLQMQSLADVYRHRFAFPLIVRNHLHQCDRHNAKQLFFLLFISMLHYFKETDCTTLFSVLKKL